MKRQRWFIFLSQLALWVPACSTSFDVPTGKTGERCPVRLGEQRATITSRCGAACRASRLAKGDCSRRLADYFKLCSNSCDIYATMALCYPYGGEELVSVFDISQDKDRQGWLCEWSSLSKSD